MVEGIPDQLTLVGSFVNTLDVEEGTDDLVGWLATYEPGEIGAADVDLARDLRTALRADLAAHDGHGDDRGGPREDLDTIAAVLPLRARFTGDGIGLAPTGAGVRGALAAVVAAVVLADRDGLWPRLKICREDTCRYAFYDWSKNSSKTWCGASCGNRNKTRAYRQRRIIGPARA